MSNTESRIFQPRHPTRNVGYIFVVVTLALILVSLLFFFNLIINDHARNEPEYGQFNWVGLIISLLVGAVLFWGALWAVRKFLSNQPQRVILEAERFVVQNDNGDILATVHYQDVQRIEEAKETLAQGQYEASYKQVRLEWYSLERQYYIILSERDTNDFDTLMDVLWEHCPEEARGPRTFDR